MKVGNNLKMILLVASKSRLEGDDLRMDTIKGVLLTGLIIGLAFNTGFADTFQEKPMTKGTAYTLNKGEWIIYGLGLYLSPSRVFLHHHTYEISYSSLTVLRADSNLAQICYRTSMAS